MISAISFNVVCVVIGVTALVLAYYINKKTPESVKRLRRIAQMPAPMSNRTWLRTYGSAFTKLLRHIHKDAAGVAKAEPGSEGYDEAELKGDVLPQFFSSFLALDLLPLMERKHKTVPDTVEGVLDGSLELEEYDLTLLTVHMGLLFLQAEGVTKRTDADRFIRLYALYEDMIKHKTKLKVTCPVCGRSLRGATQAMIGDTAVCPKCRTEFVLESTETGDRL